MASQHIAHPLQINSVDLSDMPPKYSGSPHLPSLRKGQLISRAEDTYIMLDQLERGLHDLMTRWSDGIPPEVRGELMDLYRPLLHRMIELGLRPLPR
jgi:hypothetical protein